ncbi:hypothetical protein [Photobacterium kishitanii]|nr:hypothetical protein [Photobacterium kishitanii]
MEILSSCYNGSEHLWSYKSDLADSSMSASVSIVSSLLEDTFDYVKRQDVEIAGLPHQYLIFLPFFSEFKPSEITDAVEISELLTKNRTMNGYSSSVGALKVLSLQNKYGVKHFIPKSGIDDIEPPHIKVVIEHSTSSGQTAFSLVHTKNDNVKPFWMSGKVIIGDRIQRREQLQSSLENLVDYCHSKYPHIPVSIVSTPETVNLIGYSDALHPYIEESYSYHADLLNNNARSGDYALPRSRSISSYRVEMERYREYKGTLTLKGMTGKSRDFTFVVDKSNGLSVRLRGTKNRNDQYALEADVITKDGKVSVGRITQYSDSFIGAKKDCQKLLMTGEGLDYLNEVLIDDHPQLVSEFSGDTDLPVEFVKSYNDLSASKARKHKGKMLNMAYVHVPYPKTFEENVTAVSSVMKFKSGEFGDISFSEMVINKSEVNNQVHSDLFDKTLGHLIALNDLLKKDSTDGLPVNANNLIIIKDFRAYWLVKCLSEYNRKKRGIAAKVSDPSGDVIFGEGVVNYDRLFGKGKSHGLDCYRAARALITGKQSGGASKLTRQIVGELASNIARFNSLSFGRMDEVARRDAGMSLLREKTVSYIENKGIGRPIVHFDTKSQKKQKSKLQ